jgi:hypothetical protein
VARRPTMASSSRKQARLSIRVPAGMTPCA